MPKVVETPRPSANLDAKKPYEKPAQTSSTKKISSYPPPPPPPPPPINNPYYTKFFDDYWKKYAQGYKSAPGGAGFVTGTGKGKKLGAIVPSIPPMVLPPPAPNAPATRIPNALPHEEYPLKTDRGTYILATPIDPNHLSEKQCYVRTRLTEMFIANEEDTTKSVRGRKASFVGQLGIRCVFCVPGLEPKDRCDRAIIYPTTTKKLYQSVQDMQHFHFNSCPAIPPHVRHMYQTLRGNMNSARRGSAPMKDHISPKEYWTKSAEDMGIVDHVGDDGSNVGVKVTVEHKLVERSKLPEHKKELFMPEGTTTPEADEKEEGAGDDSFDKLVAEL